MFFRGCGAAGHFLNLWELRPPLPRLSNLPARDRPRPEAVSRRPGALGKERPSSRLFRSTCARRYHGPTPTGKWGFYSKNGFERRGPSKPRGWASFRDRPSPRNTNAFAHMLSPDAARASWVSAQPHSPYTNARVGRTSTARRSRLRPRTGQARSQGPGRLKYYSASPSTIRMPQLIFCASITRLVLSLIPTLDVQIARCRHRKWSAQFCAPPDNIEWLPVADPMNQRRSMMALASIHILNQDSGRDNPCCAFAAVKREFVPRGELPEYLSRACSKSIIEATAFAHQGREPQARLRSDPRRQLPEPAADPCLEQFSPAKTFADGPWHVAPSRTGSNFDPFPLAIVLRSDHDQLKRWVRSRPHPT